MITTTDYYKDNITNKTTRWVPKVVIDYSDYNIDNTISTGLTYNRADSFPEQIADGIETPSYRYWSWPDFEWGCHLAGVDTAFEHGGISQQISGADYTFPEVEGAFYGEAFYGDAIYSPAVIEPTYSVTFTERTVNSLRVVFDNQLNHYAEEFKVYIYQGDTLAYTETVTGNTGTVYTADLSPSYDDVTRLDLVIEKWNVAGAPARVLEFYTSVQETYNSEDILTFSVSEESIPDRATIPVGNVTANTCEVELVNRNSHFDNDNEDSPLQGNLVKNRRIKPFIGLYGDNDTDTGKQNYIPLGVFYSQDWTTNNYEAIAQVSGRDIIQLMEENEYAESQFISAPADQDFDYTTTAEFDTFTLNNIVSADNELQFGGESIIYDTTASAFYGDAFYGEDIYSGNLYVGTATKTIAYTYTAGTSIEITLDTTETREDNERINYYISVDSGDTYRKVNGNFVYVPATDTASQSIILKVEMVTPNVATLMSVQDISVTVAGYVSLYSLVVKVLNDFDDATGILEGQYLISDAMGDISIPNAYLEPQTYRDAIALICQAGAARAYTTRDGYFVIERIDTVPTYEVERTVSSYFSKQNSTNPQELFNRVTVKVLPLTKSSARETIAELAETIPANTTKTYTVFFTVDPSEDIIYTSSTLPAGVSITDNTDYTWGAVLTVENTNGTEQSITLVAEGYTYTVRGAYEITLDDSLSIRKNGVQELKIENSLIQLETQADDITELLLSSYKQQRRLVGSDILPDPSLEIGDGLNIDSRGYKLYSQEISYGSGVNHIIKGVKV
mgnify:CR=1 FL=1